MSICPVQEIVGVVDGDGIGPCYLGRDNHGFIVPIHARSRDVCSSTPVGPVDMPVGANTGGPKAEAKSCSPFREMKFPTIPWNLSGRKEIWQKVSPLVNRWSSKMDDCRFQWLCYRESTIFYACNSKYEQLHHCKDKSSADEHHLNEPHYSMH